jgi:archaemetzincin
LSKGSSRKLVVERKRSIGSVSIYPFERVDLSQFSESLEAAAGLYNLQAVFVKSEQYLTSAVSETERARGQRSAVSIIQATKEYLSKGDTPGARKEPILVVANCDLFAEKMNFVFGLADGNSGIALVSTARLAERHDPELDTPLRIQERILKEAAHEIGHLMGLTHCGQMLCLMSFSENLQGVDEKLPIICEACRQKLVGRGATSSLGSERS